MAMSAEKQDLANSSFHDHKVKFAPQGWVPHNRRFCFSLTPKRVPTTLLDNQPKEAHPFWISRLTNPVILRIREQWGDDP